MFDVTDLSPTTLASWPLQQKLEYLDWAEKVVAGIRGSNDALEQLFDQTVAEKRRLLSS